MSYDIFLADPFTEKVLESDEPHQMNGGAYVVGGTRDLALNITFNYSTFFYQTMGENGIRSLYGKTGEETFKILDEAIAALGNDPPSPNYWDATPGNARQALEYLRTMAQMRPYGVWKGD